jgi:hypothetical protein
MTPLPEVVADIPTQRNFDQLGKFLQLRAIPATVAPVNTIFIDQADGKLKFRDATGTINLLY